MTATPADQTRSFWQTNRGVVALCFFVLQLLFFATDSVGVPAHAYVSGDIGGTPYLSVWFMLAFLIPAALVMPVVGSLKARYGSKTLAICGPGLFGITCLISSMAEDPQLFITMRILQGIGGGFIPAVAGGYLGAELGKTYTPMGKGMVALACVSGACIGIPISALITWHLSWRFLYVLIGLITLIAVAIISKLMPQAGGNPQAEIDWMGFGFMSGGFGLLSLSLIVGNQREWFDDPLYIVMLWTSILLLGLFAWRMATKPKLIDPRIFQDINYCVGVTTLSLVAFFLFMIFALVPRFLVIATKNTIDNYGLTFIPFAFAGVIAGAFASPGISPLVLAKTIPQKKKVCSAAIFAFALNSLWMANTNSQQYNINIGIQLVIIATCFALIACMEIQMSLTTMSPELLVSASSVLFFGTNIAKALSGGVTSAIFTATSEGSWTRFREQIHPSNTALEPFLKQLHGHAQGITGANWSQGSLELINKEIARQAEVVSYINIATLVGIVLLLLCALPFLHRSAEAGKT